MQSEGCWGIGNKMMTKMKSWLGIEKIPLDFKTLDFKKGFSKNANIFFKNPQK